MLKTQLKLEPPAECIDIPMGSDIVYGRQQAAHYVGGMDHNSTGLRWWAFGFESVSTGFI